MKNSTLFFIFFICFIKVSAQFPTGNRQRSMNAGHLYGKVVDSKTNKGLDAVTVQLISGGNDVAFAKDSLHKTDSLQKKHLDSLQKQMPRKEKKLLPRY